MFVFYFLVIAFISHYIADLIKKTAIVIMVVSRLNFGHAQICVPKIGIPMSKTACINPCVLSETDLLGHSVSKIAKK